MRCALTLAVSYLVVTGCLSTDVTEVAIYEIPEPSGDPRQNGIFTLLLRGKGFSSGIEYDLAQGTGVAGVLDVEIFDASLLRPPLQPSTARVLSPQEMVLEVSGPLVPGKYGVRLLRNGEMVAERPEGFVVKAASDVMQMDQPDAGDAGVDAGDAGVDGGDGGVDSGLGPFVEGYDNRQLVTVNNVMGVPAAARTTIKIPITHAAMVAAGRAKADGTDIALYYGDTLVPFSWEDRNKLNTDQLTMIARVPVEIPPGTFMGAAAFMLYFGSTSKSIPADDSVFEIAERFDDDTLDMWSNTTNNGGPLGWSPCTANNSGPAPSHSFCAVDTNNEVHRTLAIPSRLVNTLAANQVYEVQFFYSGRMINQQDDIFYLGYYSTPAPNVMHLGKQILSQPCAGGNGENCFLANPPTVPNFNIDQVDQNDHQRAGWRLDPNLVQPFTRTAARFKVDTAAATLYFRYMSLNGNRDANTQLILDDITIRVALQQEFTVMLGVIEHR